MGASSPKGLFPRNNPEESSNFSEDLDDFCRRLPDSFSVDDGLACHRAVSPLGVDDFCGACRILPRGRAPTPSGPGLRRQLQPIAQLGRPSGQPLDDPRPISRFVDFDSLADILRPVLQ